MVAPAYLPWSGVMIGPYGILNAPMYALRRDLEALHPPHHYPDPRPVSKFISTINYYGQTMLTEENGPYNEICDCALEVALQSLEMGVPLKLYALVIDPFNHPTRVVYSPNYPFGADPFSLNDISGFFHFNQVEHEQFDYILFICLHGRVDFKGIGSQHFDRDKYLNAGDGVIMHAHSFIPRPDFYPRARVVMFVFTLTTGHRWRAHRGWP